MAPKKWIQRLLWVFVVFLFLGLSSLLHFFSSSYRKIPCEICEIQFRTVPKSNWIIIYPGLVGCGKKCPMALGNLRQFQLRFPNSNFSFYFLVTDPKETEEDIRNYLAYYQTSLAIQALRPKSMEEVRFYRRLGAYLPEHPVLKQKDEHGTQFFLIPPNRKVVYALPKLGENDWIQIQKEMSKE
ncbi:SCO family protein [Leptospira ellinghausenii]|uniref:SCO family protein n=1 Tax=Leptospira ellinghausenii TaxID=1917822 RepID=UPI000D595F37|nr:SCO family protein [Leptospira ellinghausenii]